MFKNCIYFNLTTLSRMVSKIWQEEFASIGLSPSHGYLLIAVYSNPNCSQKELSKIMELDPSTITRFVDALVSKGLVEKDKSGKGASYIVTQKGADLSSKSEAVMAELFRKMETGIGLDQLEKVVSCIQEIKSDVKKSSER